MKKKKDYGNLTTQGVKALGAKVWDGGPLELKPGLRFILVESVRYSEPRFLYCRPITIMNLEGKDGLATIKMTNINGRKELYYATVDDLMTILREAGKEKFTTSLRHWEVDRGRTSSSYSFCLVEQILVFDNK